MIEDDGVRSAHISTEMLPEPNRAEIWREFFGRPLIGVDFTTFGDAPLWVESTMHALADVSIGTAGISGARMERTRDLIATDDNDDFAFSIVTGGTGHVAQRGQEISVGAGEAVLTSDAEWGVLTFPTKVNFIGMQLSRKALSALVPGVDDLIARPIPRNCEALQLLVSYATMLREEEQLATSALRNVAGTHLLDLAALSIGASREASELAERRGLKAGRLNAIKLDIAQALTHPDLSVATIASRHRISPRYIAMLFEEEGTSFSEFVRNQRLELAHRMLCDQSMRPGRSISEIAFEVGFNDLSYFNRCFRRRYGAAPGDIREAARRR